MFNGLGIQRKLWLLAGALLAILLLAGGLSVLLLSRTNEAIEVTFHNNGDALAYMHELTGALQSLDSTLKTAVASGRPPSPAALRTLQAAIDRSVEGEFTSVSENGEGEAAQALQQSWNRYWTDIKETGFRDKAAAQAYYRRVLEPGQQRLREQAWAIAGMNLRNDRFRDHGHRLLEAEERLMVVFLALGAALGAALVFVFGRSLLQPLLELTQGVREVEQGRLDLQVPVRSSDEMGELTHAFNAMAARLRQYERGFRARLLRAQRTTQLAINSFSDPVAVLGADGQVELCNRSAEGLFGLKAGRDLSGSALAGLQRLVPSVLQGEAHEPQDYGEALRVQVGGREKYILPRLLPVQDDRGRVVGVTLVLADVTGLRKLDEMKSGLLSTVSHELKNPLTSLRMGAHLLMEEEAGPRTPRQDAIIKSLRDNSERLHAILQDLLDLGRLDSGDFLHMELRPADLLVRESLERLKGEITARQLTVDTEIQSDLPSVAVDPRRIGYVLSNVLGNAIKFSPPGSNLWVGCRREQGRVLLWIQDSGPGVAPEYRERIFERFFRVPGQTPVPGQGLGLAIAKELAELHGGSLQIEESSFGARFALYLPVHSAA